MIVITIVWMVALFVLAVITVAFAIHEALWDSNMKSWLEMSMQAFFVICAIACLVSIIYSVVRFIFF